MKELIIFYWYLFAPEKYNRYKTLIEQAFYTEEEAFNRVSENE